MNKVKRYKFELTQDDDLLKIQNLLSEKLRIKDENEPIIAGAHWYKNALHVFLVENVKKYNVYSVKDIRKMFDSGFDSKKAFLQPSLDNILEMYQSYFEHLIVRMYQIYGKYVDRDELTSTLYYTLCKLYKRGMRLHRRLIEQCYKNEIRQYLRKQNKEVETTSLYTILCDDGNDILTVEDTIADVIASDIAYRQQHYTLDDYWEDMYERVKARILQDMSPLTFRRLLIHLHSHTLEVTECRQLAKYRKLFGGK